jgi:hypothetical protein
MRRRMALVPIAMVIGLVGCVARYVQPDSGPSAKLRMTLQESSRYFAMLHVFEKPACEGARAIGLVGGPGMVNANPENNSRVGMLGGSTDISPRVIEKIIPAERKFTLRYGQIGPHSAVVARSCTVVLSFVPRAGGEYEINYRYDGRACYAQVLELSLAPAGHIVGAPLAGVETLPADSCNINP